VAPRSRTLAFGALAALVVLGGLCAVLVGGVTGEILTIALVSAGLAGAVLLVFLEVGLSEDRERARDEERRRRRRGPPLRGRRWPRSGRRPRRPD
jgi:hypothetical protein